MTDFSRVTEDVSSKTIDDRARSVFIEKMMTQGVSGYPAKRTSRAYVEIGRSLCAFFIFFFAPPKNSSGRTEQREERSECSAARFRKRVSRRKISLLSISSSGIFRMNNGAS